MWLRPSAESFALCSGDSIMSKATGVSICLSILLLIGCAEERSEEIDSGTFERSQYHNPYFGMTLTIPSDWSILNKRTRRERQDMSGRLWVGNDANREAMLEDSWPRMVYLLAAFKHPFGSPVAYNPEISCCADRISDFSGIRTGKDYLFHWKTMLEAGQLKCSFPEQIYSESLGGAEFYVLTVDYAWRDGTMRQEVFAATMKDYALAITISFVTQEERRVLREALSTLKFSGT